MSPRIGTNLEKSLSGSFRSIIPIDKSGRVVIPKWVREGVNLQAGDEVKVSLEGQRIQLEPVVEDAGLVRKGHALVFRSKSSKPLTSEMVGKLREELLRDGTARRACYPG